MQHLAAQLVGTDQQILVIHLPSRFTDEWVSPVENEVAARLPRLSGAGLVLDFSSVQLMNSIAITCILHLQETCRERSAGLRLAGLPEPIRKFFCQLKLDRRFVLSGDVDSAVGELLSATQSR
ncbi:MAG: STAS domain-containing protein [Phycisphaerales bacterium]|nr:STAS domain-containing protein [Phycisphaerales bacterium]